MRRHTLRLACTLGLLTTAAAGAQGSILTLSCSGTPNGTINTSQASLFVTVDAYTNATGTFTNGRTSYQVSGRVPGQWISGTFIPDGLDLTLDSHVSGGAAATAVQRLTGAKVSYGSYATLQGVMGVNGNFEGFYDAPMGKYRTSLRCQE